MAEAVLSATGVSRYFGGLAAVNGVSVELHAGELHAVVGPNGAGKSTLINLLSGDLPVSAGRIRYRDADISAFSMERRSRLGIGRSYQKTNIFPGFTAFENARLAAQSRTPRPLRIFSDARRDEPVRAAEQRQLEIAMVLATEPAVLLLDEPLAGMGAEESARMAHLLRALAADHAVMLVEHDMDTVFAVADRITVMANGQVLETGAPAQIRASPAVRQVYLGETE